jgi:hypothetical protein
MTCSVFFILCSENTFPTEGQTVTFSCFTSISDRTIWEIVSLGKLPNRLSIGCSFPLLPLALGILLSFFLYYEASAEVGAKGNYDDVMDLRVISRVRLLVGRTQDLCQGISKAQDFGKRRRGNFQDRIIAVNCRTMKMLKLRTEFYGYISADSLSVT